MARTGYGNPGGLCKIDPGATSVCAKSLDSNDDSLTTFAVEKSEMRGRRIIIPKIRRKMNDTRQRLRV